MKHYEFTRLGESDPNTDVFGTRASIRTPRKPAVEAVYRGFSGGNTSVHATPTPDVTRTTKERILYEYVHNGSPSSILGVVFTRDGVKLEAIMADLEEEYTTEPEEITDEISMAPTMAGGIALVINGEHTTHLNKEEVQAVIGQLQKAEVFMEYQDEERR